MVPIKITLIMCTFLCFIKQIAIDFNSLLLTGNCLPTELILEYTHIYVLM